MAWEMVLNAERIAASGSFTSTPRHLKDGFSYHALEYEITGDGTVAISSLLSISGKHFINNGYAAQGLTKTSGAGSDGKGHIDLFLTPAEFIKIRVDATVADVVVTVWIVQK